MRMQSFTAAGLVVGAALMSGSASGALLYGLDPESDQLFSISTETGAFAYEMSVPTHDLGGLATASDGSLYMTRWNSGIGFTTLWRIDPTQKTSEFIGATDSENFQSFEIIDDVGYGVFNSTFSVDLSTGETTEIGDVLPGEDFVNFGGLAAGDDGLLYAYGRFQSESIGRFITIDPSTGQLVDTLYTTPTFNEAPFGMTYADGTLWGVHDFGLWRFDLEALEWVEVFGDLPVEYGMGLATAIPAPASILLVVGGMLGGRTRRRAGG